MPKGALSLESPKSFTGTWLVSISSMLKATCTNTIVLSCRHSDSPIFVNWLLHLSHSFSSPMFKQIQNDRIFVKSLISKSPDVLIHYPMSNKCKYLAGIWIFEFRNIRKHDCLRCLLRWALDNISKNSFEKVFWKGFNLRVGFWGRRSCQLSHTCLGSALKGVFPYVPGV